MVAIRQPGDETIGERPQYGRQFDRQPPEAEELGAAVGRTQVTHESATRGLAGAEADAGKIGGGPEHCRAGGHPGQHHGQAPADQRQRQRTHMAELVLQLAESEGADAGREIHHQDEHDGLLRGELHRLLGIDRRQRDHGLHAGLIKQDADQETEQVAVTRCLPDRFPDSGQGIHIRSGRQHLRDGTLLEQNESGQGRDREKYRRDQHGNRHEMRRSLSLGLGMHHISKRKAQAEQTADVAQRPAPARHLAQRAAPGQFRQERGDQVFAGTEEKIGNDQQRDPEHKFARSDQRQRSSSGDATYGRHHQQAFLRRMRVGIGADQRRRQDNERVGNGQGRGPGEGRPYRAAGNDGDEIRIEHGGDHHRGIA